MRNADVARRPDKGISACFSLPLYDPRQYGYLFGTRAGFPRARAYSPLLLPLSRRQGHSRFVRLPFGAFARSPAAFDPCGNLYFALGSGAHIPALLQNNCNLLPFYRNLRPFCGFRGGHARVCAYFAVNYIPPLKKPRGKTKI